MPRTGSPGLAPLVALAGVVTLLGGLFSLSPFLPFVDLPQHVALAALAAHAGQPAVARAFEVHLIPQVNTLYLLMSATLMQVAQPTVCVRLLLILQFALLAAALRSLCRALGVSAWSGVLAMLFAVNLVLWFGFMSFAMGIPVLVFLVARLAAGYRLPRDAWPSILVDAVTWLLLALAHLFLLGFGLAAAGLWVLLVPGRWRRARRLIAALPAAAWVIAWVWWTSPGAGPGAHVAWRDASLAGRIGRMGWATLVAGSPASVFWSVLGLAAGMAAALLLWRGPMERPPADCAAAARWVRAAAGLALLLYLALPAAIYDPATPAYGLYVIPERFLVLAPLLFLPTLRWPQPGRARAALAALCLAAHALLLVGYGAILRRAAADAEGLEGALDAIPPGKIVKSLIFTTRPRGLDYDAFLHVASWYQALKLGEVDQSFALLPDSPVRYRDPGRPYLSRRDEHLYPERFDWRDARLYDFLLLYDRDDEQGALRVDLPYRRVYESNGWVLADLSQPAPAR